MPSSNPVIDTAAAQAAAPHVGPGAQPAPRLPTRRFEIAALMSGGAIEHRSVAAPAVPAIEEAATAFARGTLMPTPRGAVAIEDLLPGDRVITDGGAAERVIWIGSTLFARPRNRTAAGMMRVMNQFAGDALPEPDLLVGPAARLVVRHARLKQLLGRDSVLVPLSDYADGDRFVPVAPHGPVQLYHVLLARHGLLRLGGITLETYHPGTALDALGQNGLRGAFMALFPNLADPGAFGQVALSRTSRQALERLMDG
ncbi:Hint domain-containing protein [Citreimonas sp.]|uniref:Hint domain-containing protein n=1 Tax=Citreimonas sp. TaxID=3036715 RepID=UPI004058859F